MSWKKRCAALIATSVAVLATTATAIQPADGVTVKRMALYGDSLMREAAVNPVECWFDPTCHTTTIQDVLATKPAWQYMIKAFGGTSPCDWLAQLPQDLASFRPTVVELESYGNSNTPCMVENQATGAHYVHGSQSFYDKYRADLTSFATLVRASGAKMVLVRPVPAPTNNAIQTAIGQIMIEVAMSVPGTSVTAAPRNAVSASGKYVSVKKCLATETPEKGCVAGKIPIRSNTFLDRVHFCVSGFHDAGCPTYSSGASRFAKALVSQAISPPKPLVPVI